MPKGKNNHIQSKPTATSSRERMPFEMLDYFAKNVCAAQIKITAGQRQIGTSEFGSHAKKSSQPTAEDSDQFPIPELEMHLVAPAVTEDAP